MKTLVVFPGRFQPAHLGHLSVYEYLCKKFGEESVYIATTDKTAPVTSPFDFADKVEMWTKLGVPASKIVKVKSPYNPVEITTEVPDPENTALIMAISAKDMEGDNARIKFGTKKDGSPSYMQPYPGESDKLEPMTKHAYVVTIPVTTFKVQGANANSATAIRAAYLAGNDNDRRNIIHDLYGEDDPALKVTFDNRLSITESTLRMVRQAKQQLHECSGEKRKKIVQIFETIRTMERTVEGTFFNEDLIQNYFKEK